MNEQTEKYLKLARDARESSDSEDAKKYYDLVRADDPDNAEASFYYLYYRLWDGKKGDWRSNYTNLCERTPSVIKKIAKGDQTDGEKLNLLQDMFRDSRGLWKTCRDIQMELYNRENGVIVTGFNHYCSFGDSIQENFGSKKEFLDLAIESWKGALQTYADFRNVSMGPWNKKTVEAYTDKVKQFDPSYEAPKGSGTKGCVSVKA